MADVDMTDAPASAPVTKKKGGSAAADADSKGDGKKRFEVKKVYGKFFVAPSNGL